MEKVIYTRIQNKHDTEANWNNQTNFIPKQGEIVVYDKDENFDYQRFKIGDGITNVVGLPFSGDTSAISWNDLKDRPFYADWEQGVVFDNGTITFNEEDGSYISTDKIVLKEGETYTVTWQGDSDAYTCVCEKLVDAESEQIIYMLGDTTIMGGNLATDAPFFIGSVTDANGNVQGTVIIALDGSTYAIPVITGPVEVVHEIPARYVPSDVYYVDFQTTDLSVVTTETPFSNIYDEIIRGRCTVIARLTSTLTDTVGLYLLQTYDTSMINFGCFTDSMDTITSWILSYHSDGNVRLYSQKANYTDGLPDISTSGADDGKFLRVVNGYPAWSSIPSAEEAEF